MPNTFFTADLHLGHSRILEYCARPFKDIEEMDNTLISNWNDRVTDEDDIYILGDFALCNTQMFINYLQRLKGKKHFIRGSHDQHFKNIPYIIELNLEDQHIVLCHFCLRTWPRSHYNSIMLYGHSHGKLNPIGKSWDVGVDRNEFKPLSWQEIKAIMATRPDNPNLVNRDRE